MAISVDPAAWPAILIVYEAVALTLLQTVFGRKRFLKNSADDLLAIRRYFLALFTFGLAVPLTAIFALAPRPAAVLDSLGLRIGNAKLGLLLVLIAIPVALIAGAVGSRDPEMQRFYPFSKKALAGSKTFLGYEAGYFLFYYTAWEFVFRGVLFFPLAAVAGLLPALAVSTIASTLFHIGHPDTEIIAALAAGFIFGFVAWETGSFLYLIPIHASIGMATDAFLYRKAARERSRA
ncbi:MAG: CPBP family intramembrane glutamic endopeptidase [Candidatus Aminicenantales bacterium]